MSSSLFSEQTCPRCGAKASHDSVACPVCGYWLRPMNYLPVLVVVIAAALLDIGLIVWRGVPRSALPISASELPPTALVVPATAPLAVFVTSDAERASAPTPGTEVTMAAAAPTLPPAATATLLATATDTPPTVTPLPTATATARATASPTVTAAATATRQPTAPPGRAVAVEVRPASIQSPGAGVQPDAATGGGPLVATPNLATTVAPTAAPTATVAATATADAVPATGCLLLRNYIGAELVVTVTSQDVVWATTFRVAPQGETTICLNPGRYTYTASPAGKPDQNGDFVLAAGATLEVPIVG
ncbi:MAG: hypothetical protein ACYC5O_17155 [Anaerolineae bacterium]